MAIAAQMVITERAVITEHAVIAEQAVKHAADILLKPDLPPSEEDHRRVLAVRAFLAVAP
ncbi:hypothetical protein [Kitasatospora sp. NPDC059599]|uniref:hypothetical protein n=1 Tax=Kitasatospora sp. NPDC059599 TaxID=3346880 RepID=UPI0036AB4F36